MCTCEIQWIDQFGKPTPDINKAIGRVMCKAHTFYFPTSGRAVEFPDTAWFNICEWHLRRLDELEFCHWVFEAFKE